MSSTRLPDKVMRPILGQPMFLRQVERIRRSRMIDRLITATSVAPSDDLLESVCVQNGLPCFRGSLNDVLDRFYQAARPLKPEHIVRLTADCPLTDPSVIDDVIRFHIDGGFDYTSNCMEPTFPDGLDVEVFKADCLETAWKEAVMQSQREHVTLFIHQQPGRFKLGSFKNNVDLSGLRWTVDELADFELVTMIYESLYPNNPEFSSQDILRLLEERPELKVYNTRYARNEGLEKSLREDAPLK